MLYSQLDTILDELSLERTRFRHAQVATEYCVMVLTVAAARARTKSLNTVSPHHNRRLEDDSLVCLYQSIAMPI